MIQLHMIQTTGDVSLLRFQEEKNEINILIDGGNKKVLCKKVLVLWGQVCIYASIFF